MADSAHERVLVLAAQGGDRQALATLLARHWPLLRGLCRQALGGDPALVEEAMQEAALQAMINLPSLRRADRFGPWLGGIGLNVCRRCRRYHARDAWSWAALVGGRAVTEPIDPWPGPEMLAEAIELREQVLRAVSDLPRGQRIAVLLFYLAGLPQAEVASQLGIPIGAVKTRLHKARRTLRQHLIQHWEETTMLTTTTDVPEARWIEARVADVRRRPTGGSPHHLVLIDEVGGERRLAIWVGRFEGEALAALLERVAFPRPLTFTLMAELLQAGGVRVREVHISRLVQEVFYATVVVEQPGNEEPVEVDARPSDALALALASGIPIRVEAAVLAAAPAPERDDVDALENAATIAAGIRGSSPGAGTHASPAAPG